MSKLMFKRDVCLKCVGTGQIDVPKSKEKGRKKRCKDCLGTGYFFKQLSNDERIERLEELVEFLIGRIDCREEVMPIGLLENFCSLKDVKLVKVD